jgi:hypothetical protein
MALHSYAGCVQPANVTQMGHTLIHNCNDTTASGCTVAETKPNSFGAGFAGNGGGAFGLQFDVAGASCLPHFLKFLLSFESRRGCLPIRLASSR